MLNLWNGISLLNSVFKIYVNIIQQKIMKHYSDKAGEYTEHKRRLCCN
jgi:hypothetical protein